MTHAIDMGGPCALRANVRALPLVNSWFAHPHLVSPLTFGLFTRHAHFPMLESFTEDPEQHRTSVQIPELRGGPFIDYDGDPNDIRRFHEATVDRCSLQLRCADAISALYELLQGSAKGGALAGVYGQLDELIRDKVELAYDVCKNPSARFLEKLFYESAVYDSKLQSCLLEPVTDATRPFVLSTPRLQQPGGTVQLNLPFADPLWDDIFGGGRALGELVEALRPHVAGEQELALLKSMLVPQQGPGMRPETNGVRVRYFGHACVLVEGGGTSILVDPLLSYPGESSLEHFTYADLPERIDYVLITHPHQDHLVLETLLRLRHKIDHVIVGRSGGSLQDVSLKLVLQNCGFRTVTELGEYETIDLPHGRIIGAPFYGEHGDLDVRAKLVFGVELCGKSCVFFADSNPPDASFYAPLRRLLPRIDCMFLGMECVGAPVSWAYGPLLQKMLTRGEDQSRRLDGCNFAAADQLSSYLTPEHLFVYAMGAEPWITHLTSILYSEESTQFKEARRLERALRASGRHVQVLFGMMEMDL